MIGKSSHKILKAVTQLEAELHLLKFEKLDVCIRLLFANPVTIYNYVGKFSYSLMGMHCHTYCYSVVAVNVLLGNT